jgi:hypothetical protein
MILQLPLIGKGEKLKKLIKIKTSFFRFIVRIEEIVNEWKLSNSDNERFNVIK